MVRVTKAPEVRRAELLDVASELVEKVGFDRMSVEAVTRSAGVAKGTFYHYFSSKEELLYALLERLGDGLAGHITRAVATARGTATVRLQALVDAAADYKTTHAHRYSSVPFLYRRENQLLRHRLYAVWAEATRPVLLHLIQQGVADGSFAVLDTESAADAVLTLWYEGADRLWLRAIAEPAADIFAEVLVTGGAGLKQAQERILGMPDGAIELVIDQKLVEAVTPLYHATREVMS